MKSCLILFSQIHTTKYSNKYNECIYLSRVSRKKAKVPTSNIANTEESLIMSFFFSTKDLWKSLEKLDGIVKEVTTTWQTNNIDVVIAPGFAFPAPPLKHPARLVPATSYTSVYNVMDFPAGSVPVTRVISEDEVIYSVFYMCIYI